MYSQKRAQVFYVMKGSIQQGGIVDSSHPAYPEYAHTPAVWNSEPYCIPHPELSLDILLFRGGYWINIFYPDIIQVYMTLPSAVEVKMPSFDMMLYQESASGMEHHFLATMGFTLLCLLSAILLPTGS